MGESIKVYSRLLLTATGVQKAICRRDPHESEWQFQCVSIAIVQDNAFYVLFAETMRPTDKSFYFLVKEIINYSVRNKRLCMEYRGDIGNKIAFMFVYSCKIELFLLFICFHLASLPPSHLSIAHPPIFAGLLIIQGSPALIAQSSSMNLLSFIKPTIYKGLCQTILNKLYLTNKL